MPRASRKAASRGLASAASSSHMDAASFPTDPCIIIVSSRSVTGSFLSTSSGPAALTCIPARLSSVMLVTCRSVTLSWYPHVASSRSIVDLLLSIDFLLQYVMCQRNTTCFPNGTSPRTSSWCQAADFHPHHLSYNQFGFHHLIALCGLLTDMLGCVLAG